MSEIISFWIGDDTAPRIRELRRKFFADDDAHLFRKLIVLAEQACVVAADLDGTVTLSGTDPANKNDITVYLRK